MMALLAALIIYGPPIAIAVLLLRIRHWRFMNTTRALFLWPFLSMNYFYLLAFIAYIAQ